MPYQDEFVLFWEQVKLSIQEGQFAKLTMAKTIGKQNLKNIFMRPVYADTGFKVLLKWHYRARESEDVEKEYSLEEAATILQSHLRNPFLSVLLFSTAKDVMFKINKKGAGSIVESAPTFGEVQDASSSD